jgi:hypothetical protein
MVEEKIVISGEISGSKEHFRGKKLEPLKKKETKNYFTKLCKKIKKKSDK